jgi:hypothetical protein
VGSFHSLIVDTLAPEIILGDFKRETDLPELGLRLNASDNVTDLYINGKPHRDWAISLAGENRITIPLEMGVNHIELRAVSYAGRETVQTVTVTRHA